MAALGIRCGCVRQPVQKHYAAGPEALGGWSSPFGLQSNDNDRPKQNQCGKSEPDTNCDFNSLITCSCRTELYFTSSLTDMWLWASSQCVMSEWQEIMAIKDHLTSSPPFRGPMQCNLSMSRPPLKLLRGKQNRSRQKGHALWGWGWLSSTHSLFYKRPPIRDKTEKLRDED